MDLTKLPNELFFSFVEEELACGREVRIRLKGQSMYPFIRNELDEVLLVPCKEEKLKMWDVVLFRYRGAHLLHRIVHKTVDGYTLQGDGVWAVRETCSENDIVGKVCIIFRKGKTPISVNSVSWRFFSWVWFLLRRGRRFFLRLFRGVERLCGAFP